MSQPKSNEELIEEFDTVFVSHKLRFDDKPLQSGRVTDEIKNWLRTALTEAHQAGKIQALHLLEDLYAKAEDKAELIEMFNEELQDNK